MYSFAFTLLIITMCVSLCALTISIKNIWPQHSTNDALILRKHNINFIVKIVSSLNILLTLCLVIATIILLYAFITYDFSLQYVANYTDIFLPLFYRITALWAGQAGSMLFWALSIAIFGCIFQSTSAYKALPPETKLWFWFFYLGTMAFFSFLLITWNNPFIMLNVKPPDGNGLNPLLQNPGMIFHPPLLFLGYAGFIIPSCLALAQTMSPHNHIEINWTILTRSFILIAWAFLTAGIVLGGWWAYMELGWGGYWAWDPVENASLIPWLISTAALHTIIIQTQRNKLHAVNVFLMAITALSTFFATYIVRSGIIQSVHAFGTGGVGTPLLIFILLSTLVCIRVSLLSKSYEKKELSGIDSREGFLILTAWLLLALATLIVLATMWPVISAWWNTSILGHPTVQNLNAMEQESSGAIGLTSGFYNRTCLPLFGSLMGILALCPWIGWSGGIKNMKIFILVLMTLCISAIIMYASGYRLPTAILGAASSIAIFISLLLLMIDKQTKKNKTTLTSYGIHLGVALISLGIAFSGPYKIDVEHILKEGETLKVDDFDVTLIKLNEGTASDYIFIEGVLEVKHNGEKIGIVAPQRRMYKKWGQMQFAEADTIASLGNEFYASLLAVDRQNKALFKLSSTPLVNWIWIGGALMSICPIIGIICYRRKNV